MSGWSTAEERTKEMRNRFLGATALLFIVILSVCIAGTYHMVPFSIPRAIIDVGFSISSVLLLVVLVAAIVWGGNR